MRQDMAKLKVKTKEHARFQKGNAMVEFALILPIFVTLVLGMIYYAMAVYNKTVLTMATAAAARGGAKYVATGMTDADIRGRVNTAFTTACENRLISFADPIPTPTPAVNIFAAAPRRVIVSVTIFYPGFYVFSGFNMSAQTAMMLEAL